MSYPDAENISPLQSRPPLQLTVGMANETQHHHYQQMYQQQQRQQQHFGDQVDSTFSVDPNNGGWAASSSSALKSTVPFEGMPSTKKISDSSQPLTYLSERCLEKVLFADCYFPSATSPTRCLSTAPRKFTLKYARVRVRRLIYKT